MPLRDFTAMEDAEMALATLSDTLKRPLGIPPGTIPEELVGPLDGHKAASWAAEIDLSQGARNKGMAFYLMLDRRCAQFNQENADEFASIT
jgi:hypothetical protein